MARGGKGKKTSAWSRFRSAITGRFVTSKQAKRSPRTTVKEPGRTRKRSSRR